MEKISDILWAKVFNEEGMLLGRVLELRSDGDPEHGLPNSERCVTEIIYGQNSVLQVLGLRHAEVKIVPWATVKSISHGRVVIKTSELE